MLLLIAGPVAAATHRPHEVSLSRLTVTELLSEVWDLVSRIWGDEGGSNDPFGKEGGSGDPFGNPKPNSQPPSNGSSTFSFEKEGSSGDPFGNPKPNSQSGASATATIPSSSGN